MQRPTWIILLVILISGLFVASGCVPGEHAQAQSIDGERPTPITGLSCVARAQRRTALLPLQQQALCLSAPTPSGPVDCYVEANRQLMITDPQAVTLCRCASSTAPVDCWHQARSQGRMIDDEIAMLCSPTLSLGLLANCRPAGGIY